MTKMKKNLKYEELESFMNVNTEGLVAHIDPEVRFTRGKLIHEARRVEIFYANKKPVVLLTNHFDFTVEDIAEFYCLRWAIESLYKQLKQNFPLHFFDGDSVNAIQIQTWVILIANLLIRSSQEASRGIVHSRKLLPWYGLCLCTTSILSHLWKIPKKTWNDFLAKEKQKAPPEPSLFD